MGFKLLLFFSIVAVLVGIRLKPSIEKLRVVHHVRENYAPVKRPLPDNYFLNTKGLAVYWQVLGKTADELENVSGVVQLIHGFGEYLDYYHKFVKAYNELGLVVFGQEHVGMGRSEGERCFTESFQHYVNDQLQFQQMIRKQHPELPLFVHGHSMGGLVAIHLMNQSPGVYTAGYFEAPLVEVHPDSANPILKKILRITSNILPKWKPPGTALPGHKFTNNKTLLERWNNDPLMVRQDIFVNTGFELMLAMDRAQELEFNEPFFLATGDVDCACEWTGGKTFHQKAKSPKKKLKIYPGMRHAMHHETDRGHLVISDALEWFQSFLQ